MYEPTRAALVQQGQIAPGFETFWNGGGLDLPQQADDGGKLRAFRKDPAAAPLAMPSGRIEVFSATIAGFGEVNCPGHPVWLGPANAPTEAAPLYLIAYQPATRLHSQLDFGHHSASAKQQGREVVRSHPTDAAHRGITAGNIVRIFNARGACLAAVQVTDDVLQGVVQLPTGSWYDPIDPKADNPLCVHGNPNVLKQDIGTSNLAQGSAGQLTSVEVEHYVGALPPIRAYDPPVGQAG